MVTITLQKRIIMGTLKTEQLIMIFVGNASHALLTRPPALHKQQVCVG